LKAEVGMRKAERGRERRDEELLIEADELVAIFTTIGKNSR